MTLRSEAVISVFSPAISPITPGHTSVPSMPFANSPSSTSSTFSTDASASHAGWYFSR